MKKSSFVLFIALAILLVMVLQRSLVQRHFRTEDPQRSAAEIIKASEREPDASGQVDPSAAFARMAVPSPTKPFPRGENHRRNHPVPVIRELPEDLKLRDPAVLAMTPADGRLQILPEETDLHTLRARRMVLDTGALDQVVVGATSRLLAPTTGSEVLVLNLHAVKSRSAQSHTLFGRVEGEEETSDVQLVYHDGILHGSIARYPLNQHLEYRILADGHLMVRELDHSTMTAKCGNPGESPEETAERVREELSSDGIELETAPDADGDTSQDTTGWTTIDVVVGYDKAARIADGGVSQIEARIISSVDQMSTAFANSLVTNTELMLLGTIEDPAYIFPGSVYDSMGGTDELGNLNNTSDGKLDAVSNYASQLGADLKSFVVKEADGSAGIAYLPGNSSIVARDYMTGTRITFAHELGHNLGCDHSWGDSSQAYHSRYGWRFIGTGGTKARTIMAYDWDWGTRVPYFSNPAVSYLGAATGAVNGANVLGDPTADQRFYQGGLGYSGYSSSRYGFNGSNPTLGANNAMLLKTGTGSYGAVYASRRVARATLAVTSPAAGEEWLENTARTISYKGGDMDYTASVQLFKGGVFQSAIASGFNAIKRSVAWTVPSGLPVGGDYKIRVALSHPVKGNVSVDSGFFTITNLPTTVVSQSPASTTPTSAPLGQLSVTFSAPMNPAAFSIGSHIRTFNGPGVGDLKSSITGVAWSAGNTQLTLNFVPQSTLGYYRMVFSGDLQNANGTPLDQDMDGTAGEPVEDSYVALVWVVAAGQGLQTIWSDLVGTDTRDAGWTFEGNNGTWATGNAAENGSTGPNSGADGNPIIAQNLSGNFNAGDNTSTITPTINCSGFQNVTLSFKGWRGAGKGDTFYIYAWHGGAWKYIYRNVLSAGSSNDGQWLDYTIPLIDLSFGAAVGDNNASLKLRWGLSDRNHADSPPTSGWQIDRIVVQGMGEATLPPAPRVVAHTPSGINPDSVGSIWLDFSQPMDTAGFSLADIVSFSGPAGSITATGFNWIHDSLLRIDFPVQSMEGGYALALGPQIPDTFGKNLDQDGDGTPGEVGEDAYSAAFVVGVVAGPLDHFVISGFAATQTVGTPISGITITAKDASGITVADFTGTVAFGGTGGFSGTSANFVAGQVTGVNLTPTVAGTNLTLTADDGAGHTGTTRITTIQTLYEAWAGGLAPEDDANGDGVENGLAWVLGAVGPAANAFGLLPSIDDSSGPDFFIFQYRRRDDAYNSPGTTIMAQHGGDLAGWSALIHDGTNIIITPVDNFHGAGIDKVEVRIRRTFVAGGRLFMRLAVSLPSQQSPLSGFSQ